MQMISSQIPCRFPRSAAMRRALTLVELMVAMAIAAVLMVALVSTFVMILSASEYSERQLDASANARFALDSLSQDIKALETNQSRAFFLLQDVPLAYGDLKDDDGDGVVDEEQADGRDDEGTEFVDRHAQFASAASPLYL